MDEFINEFRVTRIDAEVVASQISRQHRTHQASIIRNMLEVVAEYGKTHRGTDARNEVAVEIAVKIGSMEGNYIPYV